MRITRHFTEAGRSPYADIGFRALPADGDDGSQPSLCFPADWSNEACTVFRHRYLRKSGVPACLTPVAEDDVPVWLWRRIPDRAALSALAEVDRHGAETSARQVFNRIAGAWTYTGWRCGYFDGEDDARAFYDEMRFMLCRRLATLDAAQWQNTGLYWAYGIAAPSDSGCITDYRSAKVVRAGDEHVPPHGTFIQGVSGKLTGEGGVFDLWHREARVLAAGLETASNVSRLGEGLLGHLAAGDCAADTVPGASGRGASRLITVDAVHAEATSFAEAKSAGLRRAAERASGRVLIDRQAGTIRDACRRARRRDRPDPKRNPALGLALRGARAAAIPPAYADGLVRLAAEDDGGDLLAFAGSGRAAVEPGTDGFTRHVLRLSESDRARFAGDDGSRLWHRLAESAWSCGATGVLYDGAANRWNTCKASGEVRSPAAGADYLFLDDTACGRARLDLAAFGGRDGRIDADGLAAAARLWTIALDLAVMMTALPTPRIAARSWEFRPLGLGAVNLAGLLMSSGIAYDSDDGRLLCAAALALITGSAYATSAEIAAELGAFPAFEANRDAMTAVIGEHRRHAAAAFDAAAAPQRLGAMCRAARRAWDRAFEFGRAAGFRNAQVTLISDTADAALPIDCTATGLAPASAVIRFERMPGGGYAKSVDPAVPRALAGLGYAPHRVAAILRHVVGHRSLEGAPGVNHETLRRRGFDADALARVEAALETVSDIRDAFGAGTLGEAYCLDRLGFTREQLVDDDFDVLAGLGFSTAAVEAANAHCCGADTLEGAPCLAPEHLCVFDAARPGGARGRRRVSTDGRIRMLAAAQPFVSGAVGTMVVLPEQASVADCGAAFDLAGRLGLKLLMLDRDGAGLAPWQDALPAPQDRHEDAALTAAAVLLSGDMPDGRTAGNGFRIYDGGLTAAPPAPASAAGTKAADGTTRRATTGTGARMSQALAIARSLRALSGAAGAENETPETNRTCGGDDKQEPSPAAEASRRHASEATRGTASVPSSADAVVEQRQV